MVTVGLDRERDDDRYGALLADVKHVLAELDGVRKERDRYEAERDAACDLLMEIQRFCRQISVGWNYDAEPVDEFDALERGLALRVAKHILEVCV